MSETTPTLQRQIEHAQSEIEQLRKQLYQVQAEVARTREESRHVLQEFARELRVPLTSVLGFTDLLSVTHKGDSAELNQMAVAGHQLMKLVTILEESASRQGSGNSTAEDAVPPAAEEEPFAATRTILHIEDNETNFRLMERILEDRANITVLWGANGEEGAALALRHAPALILLDLNLPDIHGSELLRRLKNNPLTEPIPVIVVSADISPSQIERMLQAGARNYMTKPFDIKRLLCLVDEALAPAVSAAA